MSPRPPHVFTIGVSLVTFVVAAQAHAGDFDPSANRGPRITYESLAGVGGLAVGILAAVGAGAAAKGGGDPVGAGALLAVITGVAGVVLVQPAGVYLAGRVSGANGSYWSTVLGDVIGLGAAAGVGGATLAMPGSSQEKMLPVVLIGALVLPLTGAVMGYELSTHRTFSASSSQAQAKGLPLFRWAARF
jgi:hypothetical protein